MIQNPLDKVQLFYIILAFFEKADIERDEAKPNHLIIAMSSDRGLCGAVHTNVAKSVKAAVAEKKEKGCNVKLICIGDKTRAILGRYDMILSVLPLKPISSSV